MVNCRSKLLEITKAYAHDHLRWLLLDGNVQTGYAYDVSNRLTTLTDETSQNFTFGYDNRNKLITRVMPNGITTTYDYDGMSRLTRLKDVNTTAIIQQEHRLRAAKAAVRRPIHHNVAAAAH